MSGPTGKRGKQTAGTASPVGELPAEVAKTVLVALLWNPPDALQHGSAVDAHERGRELAARLLAAAGEANPKDAVRSEIGAVSQAASWAAAADYLPGQEPDGLWVGPSDDVTHPLAGEQARQTPSLPGSADVDTALRKTLNHYPAGNSLTVQQAALAVWRHLPEQFDHRLIPAHPAYPDTVWAVGSIRAAVAAARVGGKSDLGLLHFNMASVQEYIGEARRTQDLWMGSFLYAYFIWHAMKPIVVRYGPWAILTPDLRGQPFVDQWLSESFGLPTPGDLGKHLGVASLPNIFTALVPFAEGEQLARDVQESVLKARQHLADAVWSYLQAAAATISITLDKDQWDSQIKDFLAHDLFWALARWDDPANCRQRLAWLKPPPQPWQDWEGAEREARDVDKSAVAAPGAGFALAGDLAAVAVASRKNLRDFGPMPSAPTGYLCTLCGSRAALHPAGGRSLKEDGLNTVWEGLASVNSQVNKAHYQGRVKLRGRLRRGERLCAACLIKRLALDAYFDKDSKVAQSRREKVGEKNLALDRHRFPSTATVATVPFRKRLYEALADDQQLRKKAARWMEALNDAVPKDDRVSSTPKLNLSDDVKAKLEADGAAFKGMLADLERLDGTWLYTGSYTPEAVLRELGLDLQSEQKVALKGAETQYRELLKRLKERSLAHDRPYTPPARYYAVLALDGDKFGKWFTGERNPRFDELLSAAAQDRARASVPSSNESLQRPPGPLTQAALTTAGNTFSLRVAPGIVSKCDGTLIYAGGDDVLALVPRERALELALKLECAFRQPVAGDGQWLMGPTATISAAIVVAHQNEPLAEVIRTANAEVLKKVAKERYGRDSFAIRLLKASGSAATGGTRWRIDTQAAAGPIEMARLVDDIRGAFASGSLSRGLLGDVRHMGRALGAQNGDGASTKQPDEDRNRLIRAELERLTQRHCPDQGSRLDQTLGRLYDGAVLILDDKAGKRMAPNVPYSFCPDQPRPTPWDVVHEVLRAAEFLAREDEE